MATQDRRLKAADVFEGDRIAMGISPHGSGEDLPGVEYDDELRRYTVIGDVVDAPDRDDDWTRDRLRDGASLMVDFAVEADDGTVYRWHVDNGYIMGPVDHPDRPSRSDVGKVSGLYKVR